MNQVRIFVRLAFLPGHVKNAITVTIVVGTILNLINQGDDMMEFSWSTMNYPKILLTFCVPFLVSVYSAAKSKMNFAPGSFAAINARLECKNCKVSIIVKEGTIIPECSNSEKTHWKLVQYPIEDEKHKN